MGKTQTKAVQAETVKEEKPTEAKAPVSAPETSSTSSPQAEVKIKKRRVESVRIAIRGAWNNTFVSVADRDGNILFRVSTGQLGFKGNRKSTPFAGSRVATAVLEKLKGFEMRDVRIFVKGIGPGRDSALKTLFSRDLPIESVVDLTPIPFGGARPPKVRRT